MKQLLSFVLFSAAMVLASATESFAQSLPDGYDWVYGWWENPQTGSRFIISREGIQENDTRRHVCHCFLKSYPTIDVRTEPVKQFTYKTAFGHQSIEFSGPFGYERFLFIGDHELFDQGKGAPGEKLVRIKALSPISDGAKRKAHRSLGKWVLAELDEFSLEITDTTIKRIRPNRTSGGCSYSISDEGYLITDDDVFVPEDGVLHHYYSNTEDYIVSTYIRPPGTAIPLSD